MMSKPKQPEAIMHFHRRNDLHRCDLKREVAGCEVTYRD